MNRWFAEDSEAQNKAYHTLEIKDVMPGRYSAIYFAGSDESVMQNHWFRQFSELILSNNGVVAGSGSADNAITRLGLSKKIDSGYSLPTSDSVLQRSEYGSAAAEAVRTETAWMIHKNELILTESEEAKNFGDRIVDQLEK